MRKIFFLLVFPYFELGIFLRLSLFRIVLYFYVWRLSTNIQAHTDIRIYFYYCSRNLSQQHNKNVFLSLYSEWGKFREYVVCGFCFEDGRYGRSWWFKLDTKITIVWIVFYVEFNGTCRNLQITESFLSFYC